MWPTTCVVRCQPHDEPGTPPPRLGRTHRARPRAARRQRHDRHERCRRWRQRRSWVRAQATRTWATSKTTSLAVGVWADLPEGSAEAYTRRRLPVSHQQSVSTPSLELRQAVKEIGRAVRPELSDAELEGAAAIVAEDIQRNATTVDPTAIRLARVRVKCAIAAAGRDASSGRESTSLG